MSKDKVYVMRGLPGRGKSTFAREVLKKRDPLGTIIVSADDYFMKDGGVYKFDPMKLSEAHQECMIAFLRATFYGGKSSVIVDNTNSRLFEASPYVLAGEALHYDVTVVEVDVDPGVEAKSIHGVPEHVIQTMQRTFEPALPWWNVERWTRNKSGTWRQV